MKDKGLDVIRRESFYIYGDKKLYQIRYGDRRPIICVREDIERIWSHYHYKRQPEQQDWCGINPNYSLNEALHKCPELRIKNIDILKEYWELEPLIFDFDKLITINDFPHLVKTDYPEITKEERDIIARTI